MLIALLHYLAVVVCTFTQSRRCLFIGADHGCILYFSAIVLMLTTHSIVLIKSLDTPTENDLFFNKIATPSAPPGYVSNVLSCEQ